MQSHNLPPLDFATEKSQYEAKEERQNVNLNKCLHKQTKHVNGELRCVCGASWSGPRLDDLLKALTT